MVNFCVVFNFCTFVQHLVLMETTTFSNFRASLKKKLDKITDDHDILIVNRRGNKDVVVMSLKDYNALEETLYLLASKANARKLRLGIEQLKKGNVVKKSLKDL